MSAQKPSEWFQRVAPIVGSVTDRWALAGALAALVYRETVRATRDLDILMEWNSRLVDVLQAAGYVVDAKTDPLIPHPHLLVCKRGEERVDLMIANVPYQEVAIDRARDHVLTAEDVIINKLLAWRARDQEDIASILASGLGLDHGYIEYWVAEWGLEERWQEATG